jgi:hypothetical protein
LANCWVTRSRGTSSVTMKPMRGIWPACEAGRPAEQRCCPPEQRVHKLWLTPTFGIILVVSSGGEVRIGSNARLTHGFTSTRTASPSSFSSIRVKMRCKLRFWASGVIWPSIPPRSPSIRIARSTSTGWASSASAARNSALNSANLRS